MKMRLLGIAALLLVALALFSGGCQTDGYYMAQAVERARKYALSELKDLPETQRDYIRYAPPEIMESLVFQREKDGSLDSRRNLVQKCVVWKVPGLDYCIVVFGVSSMRMNDWYPCQLIKKRFVAADGGFELARKNAVIYAMDHFTYLSDDERNRIRFTDPQPLVTDFPLYDKAIMSVLKKGYDEYEKSLATAVSDLKKTEKDETYFTQTSFVWKTNTKGEFAVVTGLSKSGFGLWAAISSRTYTQAEIDKYNIFRESVIIKASQYAVINLPRLSDYLIASIRTKKPLILTTNLKIDLPRKETPGEGQISFVWDTEYRNEKAVITGVGTADLKKWEPVQAKYFTIEDLYRSNTTEKRAREKAAEFAVKTIEGLTDDMKQIVSTQKPFILRTDFDLGTAFNEKEGVNEQRAFVWVSDSKDKLITVVGTGMPSMEGWLPDKAFFISAKELSIHNVIIKKAIDAARSYAQNNIQYISYKEENRILTARPKIYETDFDIPAVIQNVTGSPGRFSKLESFLQWSFVWDSDEENAKIVISGAGRDDFSEWTPAVIFLVDNAELERSIFKDRQEKD